MSIDTGLEFLVEFDLDAIVACMTNGCEAEAEWAVKYVPCPCSGVMCTPCKDAKDDRTNKSGLNVMCIPHSVFVKFEFRPL